MDNIKTIKRSHMIALFFIIVALINGIYNIAQKPPSSNALEKEVNLYIKSLAGSSQYNSVIKSFGTNAWENVSFDFIKEEHQDGKIAYIEKETGEQITEETYDNLNKLYWEELAKDNNITYDQLFSFDNPNLDSKSAYKFHTLFIEGLEDIPAETIIIPDYELYRVSLAFNGKTVGKDGTKSYRFYISNKSGNWEVVEGLIWEDPIEQLERENDMAH